MEYFTTTCARAVDAKIGSLFLATATAETLSAVDWVKFSTTKLTMQHHIFSWLADFFLGQSNYRCRFDCVIVLLLPVAVLLGIFFAGTGAVNLV